MSMCVCVCSFTPRRSFGSCKGLSDGVESTTDSGRGLALTGKKIHEKCVSRSVFVCVCVWCVMSGIRNVSSQKNNRFLYSLNSWMRLSASSPYLFPASASHAASCRSFETLQTPHSSSRLAARIGSAQ